MSANQLVGLRAPPSKDTGPVEVQVATTEVTAERRSQ